MKLVKFSFHRSGEPERFCMKTFGNIIRIAVSFLETAAGMGQQ